MDASATKTTLKDAVDRLVRQREDLDDAMYDAEVDASSGAPEHQIMEKLYRAEEHAKYLASRIQAIREQIWR